MSADNFEPIPTFKTYTLSGYHFRIYSIEGFNFDKSIKISSLGGVYCFTTAFNKEVVGSERKEFKKIHSLIYLGKADGQRGIDGRLVSTHEHFGQINNKNPMFLGIHECINNEDPKTIESIILSEYDFIINKAENEVPVGKKTIVVED